MIYIRPYKYASKSAKALASILGINRIRSDAIICRPDTLIINWGSTKPLRYDIMVLNKPEAVALAVNKSTALQKLKDSNVRVPEFTADRNVALTWLPTSKVYARTLTRASGGRGIVIANNANELVSAPLYTKGIQSQGEYRVHVFKNEVIDYTKKIPNLSFSIEADKINYTICSHQNGWTFARNITPRNSVKQIALNAVNALGLDFGAVDIVINEHNKPVVLEVNTACGLQGRTLASYHRAITNYNNNNERRYT